MKKERGPCRSRDRGRKEKYVQNAVKDSSEGEVERAQSFSTTTLLKFGAGHIVVAEDCLMHCRSFANIFGTTH